MRPKEKGLSNDDIERIVNFDWDVSSDEESGDEMEDISGMLENNLKSILERGESIEFEHIENLIDEKSIQENSVVADNCFEKVDPKTLKWRNRPFQAPGCIWEEDSNRQIDEVKTPVEYFCSFFDNNVIDLITNQTNLYGLQEHGIELQCTGDQIKRYIGILLYLGVIKVPQFKMAWSKEYKLSAISDAMPRGKFDKIKQCLHFNDNTKQLKKGDLNYDKLYKIRPLLDILKKSFGKLPQEEHQSVDEQIIAYKGQSSYKQYNPAKPHKWGLKMFTRAGTSGLVYDFTLYVGEGTCPNLPHKQL
ncbi:piggyBac transposable element-derived protein 1-like [Drosophila elegans]|uniref:piggyBac transposable element-derived protein 1-like n=1 Tax=Drosophila elegans TaxID=30023 RepID=UPI001BC85F33|nr:piggyBac transposable element-derived protein 1-like [Drosophila elegans]